MSILSFDVGMKNLAFCILEETTIKSWNVSEIKYTTNQSLCEAIVTHLDTWPHLLECQTVLIEKQPSRNNKMRIIEALLNAYFVINGTKNENSNIKRVLVYSAKYKLGNNTMKGKTNYNERKKLSVARCKKFLEKTIQEKTFTDMFEESKKKDDLADTLLQALAYNKHSIFETLQDVDSSETKVISRKPTDKQERTGNYSRSNIKYFLQSDVYNESNIPPKILKSLKKYYKTVIEAYNSFA